MLCEIVIIIIVADIAVHLMATYSSFNTQLRGYLLSIVSPNLHPPQTELMVLAWVPLALCIEGSTSPDGPCWRVVGLKVFCSILDHHPSPLQWTMRNAARA